VKLDLTYLFLWYADDVNILCGNIYTIYTIEGLVVTSKEIGLEVTAEKTD
jgi:hypothetical protein